jgi:hypothetical protein
MFTASVKYKAILDDVCTSLARTRAKTFPATPAGHMAGHLLPNEKDTYIYIALIIVVAGLLQCIFNEHAEPETSGPAACLYTMPYHGYSCGSHERQTHERGGYHQTVIKNARPTESEQSNAVYRHL